MSNGVSIFSARRAEYNDIYVEGEGLRGSVLCTIATILPYLFYTHFYLYFFNLYFCYTFSSIFSCSKYILSDLF